ncbi:MAG TPA: hypothetical protein VLA77_04660 [Candidatus Saccharimonadales bacterium]|nr:hypothetical protein [Candidatus Saccharimonadales bacterium]
MLLALVGLVIFIFFGLVVFFGAPYVPTHKKVLIEMFDELALKRGSTFVDLGSGDGKLLKLAAQKGYKAVGYEINPILCVISWVRCWRYRDVVKIYLRNFWISDLPKQTDVVFVFLADIFMQKFKQRMIDQSKILKKPILVVSNGFKIPGTKPVGSIKSLQIYKIG